jgi:hypothetical protein
MVLSPSGFSEGLKISARVPLESSLIDVSQPAQAKDASEYEARCDLIHKL